MTYSHVPMNPEEAVRVTAEGHRPLAHRNAEMWAQIQAEQLNNDKNRMGNDLPKEGIRNTAKAVGIVLNEVEGGIRPETKERLQAVLTSILSD